MLDLSLPLERLLDGMRPSATPFLTVCRVVGRDEAEVAVMESLV